MKTNKFEYNTVIQQWYHVTTRWEDVSQYEANSTGTTKDRELLKHDLAEYRFTGYPTRVIFRKTPIINPQTAYLKNIG